MSSTVSPSERRMVQRVDDMSHEMSKAAVTSNGSVEDIMSFMNMAQKAQGVTFSANTDLKYKSAIAGHIIDDMP